MFIIGVGRRKWGGFMEKMGSGGVGEGDFILVSKEILGDLDGKMKIEYLPLKHIKLIHRLINY